MQINHVCIYAEHGPVNVDHIFWMNMGMYINQENTRGATERPYLKRENRGRYWRKRMPETQKQQQKDLVEYEVTVIAWYGRAGSAAMLRIPAENGEEAEDLAAYAASGFRTLSPTMIEILEVKESGDGADDDTKIIERSGP